MVAKVTTSSNVKLEQKLEAFAEYLCALLDLTECTILGYINAIRRLSEIIGLNPAHHALD